MLTWLRLLLRLTGLGCFLLAAVLYLLVAHHAHLTCDRAADKCVLEETRPLRAPHVQSFPLAEIVDVGCQCDSCQVSSQAATILKQAHRPFNAGNAGLWVRVGGSSDVPQFRAVVITRSGVVPVTPHYVGRVCPKVDVFDAVLDRRSSHAELDLGRWRDALLVTLMPAGMGAALLVWAGRVGKPGAKA